LSHGSQKQQGMKMWPEARTMFPTPPQRSPLGKSRRARISRKRKRNEFFDRTLLILATIVASGSPPKRLPGQCAIGQHAQSARIGYNLSLFVQHVIESGLTLTQIDQSA